MCSNQHPSGPRCTLTPDSACLEGRSVSFSCCSLRVWNSEMTVKNAHTASVGHSAAVSPIRRPSQEAKVNTTKHAAITPSPILSEWTRRWLGCTHANGPRERRRERESLEGRGKKSYCPSGGILVRWMCLFRDYQYVDRRHSKHTLAISVGYVHNTV